MILATMRRNFPLVLIGFFFITSCVKPIEEVPPSTPPMVESLSFDPEKNEFSGKVNAIGDGIKDHGFVWSLVITTPTLEDSEKKSLGTKSQPGNFTVQVDSFPEGANLTARAYMTDIYDRNFYGNVLSIQIEERVIELNTNAYQVNQQDQFTGTIQGQVTKFSSNKIVDHGHCWGLGLPTIDSAHTSLTFPSSTNTPYTFTSTLDSGVYKYGITYQIRSYAKDENDSVFYGNVQTFKVADFWAKMETPPMFMSKGPALIVPEFVGAEVGDIVLFRAECGSTSSFWYYEFGTKEWVSRDFVNLPPDINTNFAVSFVLNDGLYDVAYYGAGERCNGFQSDGLARTMLSFRRFWLDSWDPVDPPIEYVSSDGGPYGDTIPGANGLRIFDFSEGVSVVVNDKVYIGATDLIDTIGGAFVPALMEYPSDQGPNTWKMLAETEFSTKGATGFGLKGKVYFGLGIDDVWGGAAIGGGCDPYFDIYDPQTQTFSSIRDFPGGNRLNASSFVIRDKAFVGMGNEAVPRSLSFGCDPGPMLRNMWAFDPDSPGEKWTQMADYPGIIVPSFSFSYDNIGYVGAGNEIWRYYPDLE